MTDKNKKLMTFSEFTRSLTNEQLDFLIEKQWRPQTLCMLPNHSVLETKLRARAKTPDSGGKQ
jgi:hypothetical protein